MINGNRHIIKLYFKTERLSSFRVEIITDLMEYQLRGAAQPTDFFSILDVRNSKLFSSGLSSPVSIPLVNAEIAYIASIWNM
jgi:hypothetical protein